MVLIELGVVHKGRAQSGGRECPVRIFCGRGGGRIQMRTSALFAAIILD